MAWTTPRTWVAGEVVTAAIMNVHIRDNLNAIADLAHAFAESTTDDSTTSTTFVAGASPLGVVFTAPTSGIVFVTLSAYMGQTNSTNEAVVSFAVRTGGTIGSGTVVLGPSGDRSLVCGMAVVTSAPARLQASRRYPVTGLTTGSTYNVRVEFATSPAGTCEVFKRELLIEPSL